MLLTRAPSRLLPRPSTLFTPTNIGRSQSYLAPPFLLDTYTPRYQLLTPHQASLKRSAAYAHLSACNLCPRLCNVNRFSSRGTCLIGADVVVNTIAPHFGEEPCLQGHNGSGSVFFSGCNLRCVFCQNHEIAHQEKGFHLTPEELGEWYVKLQDLGGVHNVNLVTPEHVVPQVVLSILHARLGLKVPIVYNTSSFDSLASLELLDGLIDIYLPDFKVWKNSTSKRLLKADNYADVAKESIKAMHAQVGDLSFTPDGLAKSGVLLRHLVMPGYEEEGKQIVRWLAENVSRDLYVHVMEQYHPRAHVGKDRRRTKGSGRASEVANGVVEPGGQAASKDVRRDMLSKNADLDTTNANNALKGWGKAIASYQKLKERYDAKVTSLQAQVEDLEILVRDFIQEVQECQSRVAEIGMEVAGSAHAALDTVHATGAEGLQKWAESEHDADGIIEKLEVVPRGLRGEIRVLEDEARELKTKIADVEKAKSKVEEENSDLKRSSNAPIQCCQHLLKRMAHQPYDVHCYRWLSTCITSGLGSLSAFVDLATGKQLPGRQRDQRKGHYMLSLLYTQHRYYTSELASTHQKLGQLYKKLAKIELHLTNWESKGLNRKDKKKVKWTQTVTEQSVQNLEGQQVNLEQYLRQCNELIAAYEPSVYHLPTTPWTAHLPTSPWRGPTFSAYSPVAPSPWTRGERQGPQYWDLSMLRERRRQSSPNDSSADSGFHEPTPAYTQSAFAIGEEAVPDPDHVFAHELIAATAALGETAVARSGTSSVSESKDEVPELPASISNTAAELDAIAEGIADLACLLRRRRHSENAIQLVESQPRLRHQRGESMGAVPGLRDGNVV
ncbi:hypothetical protein B0A55_00703 [Friedmanniomyces simplex]|uniref:Radical SAM core domain-containing protein n=1 Tax=Friedmanniomyces simplex TaxID=329884 RepID=A0A4U0Y1A1_9PEZI|nr:hypothetical protein B0A55_00703 [Friedmanniomyces simplex]